MGMSEICYKCLQPIGESESKQHGLHTACFREWFLLQGRTDFSKVVVKNAGSSNPIPFKKSQNRFEKINSSFFHGRYKKYSAELGGQLYILKVKDKKYPELPATEYLCNQIARFLRINVPNFYYIKFQGKTDTFVTRNFIPDHMPANLIHIYMYLNDENEFNCRSIIDIIERRTGRISEVEKFVEICLFDALIGNNDRHGRNLALIESTKKGTQLAPFYDNPSYLGVEEEDLLGAQIEPMGKISTSASNEPSMKDYVKEFRRLGHETTLYSFLKKLNIKNINGLIDNSFISKGRKRAIQKLIERRYGEIQNEMSR